MVGLLSCRACHCALAGSPLCSCPCIPFTLACACPFAPSLAPYVPALQSFPPVESCPAQPVASCPGPQLYPALPPSCILPCPPVVSYPAPPLYPALALNCILPAPQLYPALLSYCVLPCGRALPAVRLCPLTLPPRTLGPLIVPLPLLTSHPIVPPCKS